MDFNVKNYNILVEEYNSIYINDIFVDIFN